MPPQHAHRLTRLRQRQDGVVSRRQLRQAGISRHVVRAQLLAGRWQTAGRQVVVLHNGPLTEGQRLWLCLLNAGDQLVALAAETAAEAHGLRGFEPEMMHVVVPHGARVHRMPGVRVHVSRRLSRDDLHPAREPATVTVERAVVDAAVWSRSARRACAILAAAVQQRLTTAGWLREELLAAGRVRHRKLLLAVLADIDGGSHSLAEIDVVRLCRRGGLPEPARQVVRHDRRGKRRYLDVTWHLPDGRVVVVEVDGALHLLALDYWADMDREIELVITGLQVVRIPSVALRLDPARVLDQLRRLLLDRPARQDARYPARPA